MTERYIPYQPEIVTPPGETLVDLLEEQAMTQTELAMRMGRPTKTINEIVHGKTAITPETALQLEKIFATPADYWLNHEANYRAYLARLEEEKRLSACHDWLAHHPVRFLKQMGILPNLHNRGKNKTILLQKLLGFYAVASPEEWETYYGEVRAAYRRSQAMPGDPYATVAWLRLGELEAAKISCPPFDRERFATALQACRALTLLPPEEFEPRLKSLCAEAGVMLILLPGLPGARVSGVARWLYQRPFIQLSLYGKTNDKFWFNFFHEAAHILLHSHKLIFLDEEMENGFSQEEEEANAFAASLLIPPVWEAELPELRSREVVRAFAGRIGIHPGIVVGRLQHDQVIEQSWLNDLKERFTWSETLDE